MKSYEWKPYRTKENDEGLAQTEPSSSTTKPSKAIDQLIRKELVQVMGYEHPIVTLTVGTLKANAERATGPDSEVVKEVVREITEQAAFIKRRPRQSLDVIFSKYRRVPFQVWTSSYSMPFVRQSRNLMMTAMISKPWRLSTCTPSMVFPRYIKNNYQEFCYATFILAAHWVPQNEQS
ncbi:hypothetical protein B0O80DRAFT_44173 [Mortierella sp. GBAus27b]|nr:hypothetical protein B0O80DRAFT_44173 [Mortierella sp. GBAus27b]